MRPFIHENFQLTNVTAERLYHNYAKQLPIYDYHCHLSPLDIAENRKFKNITELWLEGDHYKWRAMRAHGIEERLITGDADPKEKFAAWARTVPYTVGNPLYHWTHLELKNYFGIDEILNEDTWEEIWESCNQQLQKEEFTVQALIQRSNVNVICTTDDPTDDLANHERIKQLEDFAVQVLPTFRPDKGLEINKGSFVPFVKELEKVVNKQLSSYEQYLEALEERIDYFHERGCRISDHGLGVVPYKAYDETNLNDIFMAGKNGQQVSLEDEMAFKTAALVFLAKCYKHRGWAMQIHFGAIRNNNQAMFDKLGPDAGFDSINDQANLAEALNGLLNKIEQESGLPRTILYNLNPTYYDLVASTIGNFQTEAGIQGKIQFGSGWWFNDTKRGMIGQMTALADHGLLMHFVGMLTDSRSFISYSRHEYFRRILCNLVGSWVEDGDVPNDPKLLQQLIENVCYYNAKNYFSIELND